MVDLRRLSAQDLEPLLQEEIAAWREELEWDFEKSADLVRRFVDMRALAGYALEEGGRYSGYLYYVLEENKGLIGDLYVARELRRREREDLLLEAAVEGITANRYVRRIESQLLMMCHAPDRKLPYARHSATFERNFMRVEFARCDLQEGRVRRPMHLEPWHDHYQDAAAKVIAAAYQGHVDSRINDQYRSTAGAGRFLYNIVQFPGCGTFFRPASFVAVDGVSGAVCGISLASLVAPECGHITQICVSPEAQGTGIGHAMLRRSLLALREMGCRAASLTVTATNREAVVLYERVGFRTMRKFSAYAWEGF